MGELKAFQWQDNWGGGSRAFPEVLNASLIRLILYLIIQELQMKATKLDPFILLFEAKQIVNCSFCFHLVAGITQTH